MSYHTRIDTQALVLHICWATHELRWTPRGRVEFHGYDGITDGIYLDR